MSNKISTIKNPLQAKCIKLYTNPESNTFGNLYQSAVESGFKPSYARAITGAKPSWITETLQNTVEMIQASEKNLKRYATIELRLDTPDDKKENIDLAKLQVDVSKFIAKTLAKAKYSEEKKHKAQAVQINIIKYNDTETEPSQGHKVIDVEID